MRYVCLVYMDDSKQDASLQPERVALMGDCMAYDAELRKNGNLVGGEALQPARNAATIKLLNGNVVVTDGPFAETKEHIGGIVTLEAKDLNHAIRLISNHPSLGMGVSFEIRPSDEEIMSRYLSQSNMKQAPKANPVPLLSGGFGIL